MVAARERKVKAESILAAMTGDIRLKKMKSNWDFHERTRALESKQEIERTFEGKPATYEPSAKEILLRSAEHSLTTAHHEVIFRSTLS